MIWLIIYAINLFFEVDYQSNNANYNKLINVLYDVNKFVERRIRDMRKLQKLNKKNVHKTTEYTLEAYTCCSSCGCIKTDAVNDNAANGWKANNK